MMLDFSAERANGSSWNFNRPYEAYEAMRRVEEQRALLINICLNHAMYEKMHVERRLRENGLT